MEMTAFHYVLLIGGVLLAVVGGLAIYGVYDMKSEEEAKQNR